MNEESEKKYITKCWTCEKKLFHINEYVVIRWSPSYIGSYCFECNPNDDDSDDSND